MFRKRRTPSVSGRTRFESSSKKKMTTPRIAKAPVVRPPVKCLR
jgi:hypothetical protein